MAQQCVFQPGQKELEGAERDVHGRGRRAAIGKVHEVVLYMARFECGRVPAGMFAKGAGAAQVLGDGLTAVFSGLEGAVEGVQIGRRGRGTRGFRRGPGLTGRAEGLEDRVERFLTVGEAPQLLFGMPRPAAHSLYGRDKAPVVRHAQCDAHAGEWCDFRVHAHIRYTPLYGINRENQPLFRARRRTGRLAILRSRRFAPPREGLCRAGADA